MTSRRDACDPAILRHFGAERFILAGWGVKVQEENARIEPAGLVRLNAAQNKLTARVLEQALASGELRWITCSELCVT
jgi:hypothetical protein